MPEMTSGKMLDLLLIRVLGLSHKRSRVPTWTLLRATTYCSRPGARGVLAEVACPNINLPYGVYPSPAEIWEYIAPLPGGGLLMK